MKLIVYDIQSGYIKQILDGPVEQLDLNRAIFECEGFGCLLGDIVGKFNKVENGQLVFVDIPADVSLVIAKIKFQRNQLLQMSDWTQMPDVPLSEAKRAEWAVYRQALRDFPETCDINNPVWPKPPA